LAAPVARRVSWSSHGHFEVNGNRVDVPSYRVEQYDIITCASSRSRRSRSSWPARPSVTARPRRGCRSSPGSLPILIHQLPVREQIVVDLTEQLIVELYSKN
jgi:small subunit ribosomal protein S4